MTSPAKYLKEHPEAFWLLAILVLSAILRLAFLHEPFDRDEGQYAAIAQNILRGGLPYRDAIEIKPPGAFYLYALGIGLFGATTEALRIFAALYSTLTVIAVFGTARHLAGTRSGLWAALLYGVYSTFPLLQGSGCNTEVFLVLPMTAGVWLFLKARETGKRPYFSWAGLCAALALLIKPQALPLVALEFLLIPFLKSSTGRMKDSAFDMAAFALPVLACALATLTYFSLKGGLSDCLYWTVEFPRRYVESGVDFQRIISIMRHLFSSLLVPVVVGVPSALWLASAKRDIKGMLPLLTIVAAGLGVALPGKYYPHYFIMIIPFLAIAGGIGLANLTRMTREALYPVLLVLFAAIAFSLGDNYKFYTTYSPEEVSIEKYHLTAFVESLSVARYLREHTRTDDYIFQWGLEPELYFLADRPCPNPYLVSLLPAWSKDPRESINGLMQSLIDKKPAYIVFQPEWADFEGVNEVYYYMQKNCRAEKTIGYANIFRCSAK